MQRIGRAKVGSLLAASTPVALGQALAPTSIVATPVPVAAPTAAPAPAPAAPRMPTVSIPVPAVPGTASNPFGAPVSAPAPVPTPSNPQPPSQGQVVIWRPWYPCSDGIGIIWNTPWAYGYRQGFINEPLRETARRVDPQVLPLPAAIPATLTPHQTVLLAFRTEQYDAAANVLTALLARTPVAAPPGSAAPVAAAVAPPVTQAPAAPTASAPIEPPTWTPGEMRRLLAFALIGQKRYAEGVRAMTDAYAAEPALAAVPLPGAAYFSGSSSLRQLVVRAVSFAQRTKSDDAWFAAAVLMQAEGRDSPPPAVAARMKLHRVGATLAWRGTQKP